jgi:hypothetical protein
MPAIISTGELPVAHTTIGNLSIQTVVEENALASTPGEVFPDATAALLAPHVDWLAPNAYGPAQARITRRRFLEAQCDQDILMMTAHFPLPSMGHVVTRADGFGFRYLDS